MGFNSGFKGLNQQADSSADSSDSLGRWIQFQSQHETDILKFTF